MRLWWMSGRTSATSHCPSPSAVRPAASLRSAGQRIRADHPYACGDERHSKRNLVHAALGAPTAKPKSPTTGRAHARATAPGAEKVPLRTLSSLIREQGLEQIDLLKLDCEGAEWDILPEAELILPRIRQICMEFHCERGWTRSVGGLAPRERLSGLAYPGRMERDVMGGPLNTIRGGWLIGSGGGDGGARSAASARKASSMPSGDGAVAAGAGVCSRSRRRSRPRRRRNSFVVSSRRSPVRDVGAEDVVSHVWRAMACGRASAGQGHARDDSTVPPSSSRCAGDRTARGGRRVAPALAADYPRLLEAPACRRS